MYSDAEQSQMQRAGLLPPHPESFCGPACLLTCFTPSSREGTTQEAQILTSSPDKPLPQNCCLLQTPFFCHLGGDLYLKVLLIQVPTAQNQSTTTQSQDTNSQIQNISITRIPHVVLFNHIKCYHNFFKF